MRMRVSCKKPSIRQRKHPESGVALILALLSLFILSLLAMGLISSTQSELWGTANYRKAAQARYLAEAGAQQTVNWLANNFATNASAAGLGSANFNLLTSPALYTGTTACASGCLIRMTSTKSTLTGGITDTVSGFDNTSNALESGFSTALGGTSGTFTNTGGTFKGTFNVAAQLIYAYNLSGSNWVTKWKITSQGTVGATQPATVQVVEVVEDVPISGANTPTPITSINYGAFATSASCNAITINGGSSVTSYDSSKQSGVSNPTWTYSGGSIATFGNVALSGSGYVYGNVYAPGYNLGNSSATVYYPYGVSGGGSWPYNNGSQACSSSKLYAVNEDNSGSAIQCSTSTSNCTNKASALPSTYTTTTYPSADYMVGNTQITTVPANTSSCSYSVICSGGSGYYDSTLGKYVSSVTLPPSTVSNVVNYGAASFGGSTTTTLNGGSYFFDTFSTNGSANIQIGASPVTIYVMDGSGSSTPINISGGSFSNSGGTPSNLTFVYNGTQTVHIGNISNNTLFAAIYAPNAKIVFDGNGSIYGAVIGSTVSITSGGHIIYDTTLASTTTNIYIPSSGSGVSPFHLTNFSWSVY